MKMPIYKKRSVLAEIIQLSLLGLFVLVFYLLIGKPNLSYAIIFGTLTYFFFTIIIPSIFIRSYKKGVVACKSKDFENALIDFKSSYDFFNKYPLLDKWRYILLGNTSSIPFKVMNVNNIAYCYKQLGNESMAAFYVKEGESLITEKEIKNA